VSPSSTTDVHTRVLDHIERIWGTRDSNIADTFIQAIGIDADSLAAPPASRWDEADVALITYGDSIVSSNGAPLRALASVVGSDMADAISIVHVLPFSPYSSDRGFSVIDYEQVDPNLGTWADMEALGDGAALMFDLVLNHCSAESQWFKQFLRDESPGNAFIKTADASWDLGDVVRPRSTPLLTEFETAIGPQLVWTTFGEDQVDLDWSNPDLVAEMLRIIDLYLRRGARLLRLDAVAYIWKVPGTTSIHLPETHEMVRLLHTLLAERAPEVSIITETNVPDRENRTYFGNGDEAHLIYNFTLPPLAIDGVINGRADRLVEWMDNAAAPPSGTTLFNFLASHDGIGVRPAEGFLTSDEIARLVDVTDARGGFHGTYDRAGVPHPYELNISFPDLFGGPDDPFMVDRILLLHTIVLALAGVPAIYINSLMATTNDLEAVEADGIRRSVNRRRIDVGEVPPLDGDTWCSRLYRGLLERAALRRNFSAFHPDGAQSLRDLGGVLAIDRTSVCGGERIIVLCNMTSESRTVAIDGEKTCLRTDVVAVGTATLAPYQALWLR
jgi:glycosidase